MAGAALTVQGATAISRAVTLPPVQYSSRLTKGTSSGHDVKGAAPAGGKVVRKNATAGSNKLEYQGPKEGFYEFPDARGGGKPYVGQSENIPQRLQQHQKAGRLTEGTAPKATEVPGGKTAREIAEHQRIQERTGGVPTRQSPNVTNQRDPIGPNRKHLLEQ